MHVINTIGFDVKAATPDSESWLFPFDGASSSGQLHDQVIEFVIGTKRPGPAVSTGGNVDLQKLLGAEGLKVHSIDLYIEEPLVAGNWTTGYGDFVTNNYKSE